MAGSSEPSSWWTAAVWTTSIVLLGCGGTPTAGSTGRRLYRGSPAPLSRAADDAMVFIPAGGFASGSTPEQREQAYEDYRRTSGQDAARRGRWFDREAAPGRSHTDAFRIDLTPVTNAAYAEFVRDTGHRPPGMDEATWLRQGYSQSWTTEVRRFVWSGNEPAPERAEHPVVLVSWDDARAYCRWRGDLTGTRRRLPSAAELEKAARGPRGSVYPWGPDFDPARLNSAVDGPRDTVPVGSHPDGASPYGVQDLAGNVFQWTSTERPPGSNQFVVKGSAWDDYGGVGRGSSWHTRPRRVRHAIVGFRCAGASPSP